ncbi:sulfatase [Thermostilla marina]
MDKWKLIPIILLSLSWCALETVRAESPPVKPNFLIIFCDDLGYGDLSCFGHPTIRTPNLDRMAAEGQRWTDFYVAACVCTPSRAALITGRLPVRTGMCSDKRRVLFPDSAGGLQASEYTIAEALHDLGYTTHCIGKWHLGHLPQYLPTAHGFESYFGIPYSNDMDRVADSPRGREAFLHPKPEYFNVPLMRNTEIVERPANQYTLIRRYTDETIRLIRENRDRPFFIYLAHNLPHVPLFNSPEFNGHSRRGLYGDVVEEIDHNVGRILETLKELKLDKKTLVVFTSDNGPWLIFDQQGGSAGLLRGGKGSTWEGGMREPTIFWWPGTIAPKIVEDIGCTMDLLPTFVALAGGSLPEDLVLDGYDISPALLGTGASPRDRMFYYRGTRLFAVRYGRYKAHFQTQAGYGQPKPEIHDPPLLYDLWVDPGEQYNIATDHPDVIAKIRKIAGEHEATLDRPESQLEKVIGK